MVPQHGALHSLDPAPSGASAAERSQYLWRKLAEAKNSYHVSSPDLWLQHLMETKVVKVLFFFLPKFRLAGKVSGWTTSLGEATVVKNLLGVLLFPIHPFPSRDGHRFPLSLLCHCHKREKHRLEHRQRSYQPVFPAGHTDWTVHSSHQTSVCLDNPCCGSPT